jgi:bacillithiol biosynthesis deacetylase BshB1
MDLLTFGAHPDDCELFAGGLLAKLARRGYRIGIVDLTRGEMSSRGTVAERLREIKKASKILGLSLRETLNLGDTRLANTPENRLAVIRVIRQYRPRLVLYQYPIDRHPDHVRAALLVKEACFYSHLVKIRTRQKRHRPSYEFCFFGNIVGETVNPSFIVDISDTFEQKLEALKAFSSQFYNPAYQGSETYISSEKFFEYMETRAKFYGAQIGVQYGEPYVSTTFLRINDPIAFYFAD